jgi:5'-nucleotidase
MRILLTNDDGIESIFLRELALALINQGHDLSVVAPRSEQSWVGASKSRNRGVHSDKADFGFGCPTWSVEGTPSDCVNIAIDHLLDNPPEGVVSGINIGLNTSLAFIIASGTVAGALEGAVHGLPAVAFSQEIDDATYELFKTPQPMPDAKLTETLKISAGIAAAMAESLLESIPRESFKVHNINFPMPCTPQTRVKRTVPAHMMVPGLFTPRDDAGKHKLIFARGNDISPKELITDKAAIAEGFISHSLLDYTKLGS